VPASSWLSNRPGHGIAASPFGVGYAIAIPVAVFLLLTWALHAPIASRPMLRPGLLGASCLLILILPALAVHFRLVVVLASIATVCASVVAITLQRPVTKESVASYRRLGEETPVVPAEGVN
jgi:hypothetical protein